MDKFDISMNYLLKTNPYYAHFLLNCRLIWDDKNVPTAAVAIRNGELLLYINREWAFQWEVPSIADCLAHEVLHILLEHTNEMGNKELHQEIANIAMDCSINQYLYNMPEGTITLEMIRRITNKDLDAKQTWEYYYYELIEKAKQLSSVKPHDCHDMESDKNTQMNKAIVTQVAAEAAKQAAGNIPEEVQRVLVSLLAAAKLSWQQLLKNFIAKSARTSSKFTRKKPDRRRGLEAPGKIKKRELVLGVCVDSSGSVSDEAYLAFMCEIQSIAKHVSLIHLIDADCEVHHVEKVKKGQRLKPERYGHGGTAYQPGIDKAMSLKCDAIILFGDGDTADTPKDPKVPFLWVLVGNSPKPGNFGSEIRLT